MPALPIDDLFHELVAQGLIAAQPAPQRLAGGNQDRRPAERESWIASLPDGGQVKLTVAPDLGTLPARHAAFAAACPAIIPAVRFHLRLPHGEVLGEEFISGRALDATGPDTVERAVNEIDRVLAASARPSTEAAQAAEWAEWTARLRQSPAFTAREHALMADSVLPALYAKIRSDVARTRWSNGDFLPGNILVDDAGRAHLIDLEFARCTHFSVEDAVRFRVLARSIAVPSALPDPGPPWHLYFWLRQFQLESEQNTSAYLQRVRPRRLAAIRRLAEYVTGSTLPDWSTPAAEVHFVLENAVWMQSAAADLLLAGWCHVPAFGALREVVATAHDRRFAATAPVPRPDVQKHFQGEPRALQSGFQLTALLPEPDATVLLSAVMDDGTMFPCRQLRAGDLPLRGPAAGNYEAWAAQYDPDPPAPAAAPATGPLFSILLPVYRTPPSFLAACISSVTAQHYPRWELIVVDDGSQSPELTAQLNRCAADPRIRLLPRAANGGIARATNDALAAARGDFIALLDHDDLLRPHALTELAAALAADPTLDAVYSDEDKISEDGRRIVSFLKPDFSPEYLLGVMYVGHVLCVRTRVARAAGGFDPAYDGIQDYEFFLRVTEHTRRIGHVPRILYHWRQSPGSSALHGNVKGDMDEKQRAAVAAHLGRRGDPRQPRGLGRHRLRLDNTAHPGTEIVAVPEGQDGWTVLQAAAGGSVAEIMVLMTLEESAAGAWVGPLTALAARPDSGCVAPLLLARDGKVLESGRCIAPGATPIMRGFDPGGDGYNGSLLCDREVDYVGPLCVAVRRALVTSSVASDWPGFCADLAARGLFHRVCSAARLPTSLSWRDPSVYPAPAGPCRFFNPHFDPRTADYRLADPPLHLGAPSVLQFHIDEPNAWDNLRRNVIVRGWCFARPGRTVTAIRLQTEGITLDAIAGLPRPDVRHSLGTAPDDNVGFEIRGTLPAGRTLIRLEARLAGGEWVEMLRETAIVKGQGWPLWLGGGDWRQLILFQMPAHMAHPPRAIVHEKFPRRSRPATEPKLTIVTPSYQQARFLEETLRSVLEQPGVTPEYVVQDGGSTDGSAEIIQRHAARLSSWSSAPDAGQADAIARGFAQTKGGPDDLMAWINSDDFYLPGALGFVTDYFARHPEVDAIYGHRIVVNGESKEIARWFMPPHDEGILRLNDFVPQETLFWRRRLWDRVGGINRSLKFAMDWDLLLRFQAADARIVRVPYFLACFRVHAAQKTSAQMHLIGQREIDRLRTQANGREISAYELEHHPRLLRYLRHSAWIEFLWKLGVRAP